jgi:hypothetical protein
MKMEHTQYSETLAFKIQTQGNHPEESARQSEQEGSLKSSICFMISAGTRWVFMISLP